MKKYSIAIIGGGIIAEAHLQAMDSVEQAQAVAIAETSERRLAELHKKYAGLKLYTDYGELLARERPDIAIITLPHFLHREAAIRAAQAGCHILLEKPMALNTRECDEIIAAVEASGVRMLVGHTQHYFPENRAVKAATRSGELGRLVMISDTRHLNYFRANRPDWFLHKALSGGGIMMNLGSHSIDKLLWFTDSPIVSVKAGLTFFGDRGDVEGSGVVMLQHESGVCSSIVQSGYRGSPSNVTELSFTEGRIRLQTGVGAWISRGDADYEPLVPSDQANPMALQIRDLIASIETGREPLCTMAYSRAIIEVVEALYRSHETGREVVLAGAGQPSRQAK